MVPGKIHYTNEQMKGDLHEIIRQVITSGFVPDVIVGIARGGLVPATMLSHYFNAPLVCLNVSLRDNKVDNGHDSMDTLADDIRHEKRILLVDDICDSGETLRMIYEKVDAWRAFSEDFEGWRNRVRTAVLWNNTAQDEFEADYVGREISRADDERWVIFPYEEWWKA